MSLTGLLAAATADPALTRVRELAAEPTSAVGFLDVIGPVGTWSTVVAAIADRQRGAGRPVLAVAATGREASELAEGLRCYLPGEAVVDFPSC
jgi:transcription-repair coupling factor (superfamily II helicase)